MRTKGLTSAIILFLGVFSIFFLFSAPREVSTSYYSPYKIPHHLQETFKRIDPLPPPYAPEGAYGYSLPPVELTYPADDDLFLMEGFLLSEPANIIAKFNGQNTYDYSGYSLSRAGDINGDGVEDIIIGAWGYSAGGAKGRSYLIFGDPNFSGSNNLSGADVIFEGVSDDDSSGISVACAGDVNGDGCSDILIGAQGASEAYLIYGNASLTGTISMADSDVIFSGESSTDAAGRCVAGGGDVNGDGCSDILIGAPYYSTNTGKCYLIYGSSTLSDTIDLCDADASFTGESTSNYAGYRVCMAGDVNGDHYDDIFISS